MIAVMMTLELLSTLFVLALGCVVLFLIVVYRVGPPAEPGRNLA
jgi:hypothetical protein